MPRLRNARTGVVVNVDDATAKGLGSEWGDPDKAVTPTDGAPKGNASREVWAAYADSLGVEYAEDAKRDDIKAAVEAASADSGSGDDPDADGDEDPADDE